jgi:hypothetical protein
MLSHCPESYVSVGYFTCSAEEFVGQVVCLAPSQNQVVKVVTKIAGTMEVGIDVPVDATEEAVKDMFKAAIAAALGIAIEDVVKLVVVEAQGSGSRRLQSIEAKKYGISYEAVVPDSMDPNVLASKADGLSEPSSAESQVFRQVLAADYGAQVSQIELQKIARPFEDEVIAIKDPSPDQGLGEEPSDSSATGVVLLIISLTLLCCLSVVGVLVVVCTKKGDVNSAQRYGDIEAPNPVVRIPSNTLLESQEGQKEGRQEP